MGKAHKDACYTPLLCAALRQAVRAGLDTGTQGRGRGTWFLNTLSRGGETTASLGNFWKPELIRVPGHARWREDAGHLPGVVLILPLPRGRSVPLETPCLCDLRPAGRQVGASVFPGFYPRRPAFCLCVPAPAQGASNAGPGLGAGQPWTTPGSALTGRPLTHVSLGPRASSSV